MGDDGGGAGGASSKPAGGGGGGGGGNEVGKTLKKVLVRVVEGRGLRSLVFIDASVQISLRGESVESNSSRKDKGRFTWGVEGLFTVGDETEDVVSITLQEMRQTRGRVRIPLKDVFEGRSERWFAVGGKEQRGGDREKPEIRVVLKCYGFGRTIEVSEAALLGPPPLPKVEVSELDMLLYPSNAELQSLTLPAHRQFWTDLAAAVKADPTLALAPPLTRLNVRGGITGAGGPSAPAQGGGGGGAAAAAAAPSEKATLLANVGFVRSFHDNWRATRTHRLTITDTEAGKIQTCCVTKAFWSTFISVLVMRQSTAANAAPFREGDAVAYRSEDKRDPPKAAKVQAGPSSKKTYDLVLDDGTTVRHAKATDVRRWKDRQAYVVNSSSHAKNDVWVSKKEWEAVVEEWSRVNNLGRYAWQATTVEEAAPSPSGGDEEVAAERRALASVIKSIKFVEGPGPARLQTADSGGGSHKQRRASRSRSRSKERLGSKGGETFRTRTSASNAHTRRSSRRAGDSSAQMLFDPFHPGRDESGL
eukprot:Rhum_TRINITY_DN13183_c0_g1::Rhum_TRINITY_DN13183_c0_g1_i1::g.57388::m.57388